jgi:YegS/Rv2252/BmrU family lipid kinase
MRRCVIEFSKITVVMNPTAGADTALDYRTEVLEGLHTHFPDSHVEILHTASSDDPAAIGREDVSDLILCLSGDGTVHGVLQGLMQRPRAERPALCVLPLGSGNDIARTFGIPASPTRALPSLAQGRLVQTDVGHCLCDNHRTAYFLETLSFGVDAAVALKTVELRKRTKNREALLYAQAAVDAIIHELHENRFHCTIDGEDLTDDLLIMAIQNGPTYGGGFKVAPSARIDDGLLNICIAAHIKRLTALYYLSRMKTGTHERLKGIRTYKAARIIVETEHFVPTQVDGEALPALRYEISVIPQAIDFLAPA